MNGIETPQPIGGTLVVGVSGHRDILATSLPSLLERINQLLASLRNQAVGDCLLLSGMAEGADLIAARAALNLDFKVEAVLAMPPEAFESDMSSPSAVMAFRDVLPKCQAVTVVGDGTRPASYEAVADQIAHRSDVLLLIWDGAPARGRGGTADVLERFVAAKKDFSRPDGLTGLILHVKVERSSTTSEGTVPQCFWKFVGGADWEPVCVQSLLGRIAIPERDSP